MRDLYSLGLGLEDDEEPAEDQQSQSASADLDLSGLTRSKPPSATATDTEDFEAKLAKVEARMRELGFKLVRTSKQRTTEEQQKLYQQGRGAPGKIVTDADGVQTVSRHQSGEAVDFAFDVNGRPSWDDKHPWNELGRIAKEEGLEWGGDWKGGPGQVGPDRPHVQMPKRQTPPAPAPTPATPPARQQTSTLQDAYTRDWRRQPATPSSTSLTDIAQGAPQMRESDATAEAWQAWNAFSQQNPDAAKHIKAIRSNPNLAKYGIVAQVAPDGAVEIDPAVKDPKQLQDAFTHELVHAKGGDETAAQKAEKPALTMTDLPEGWGNADERKFDEWYRKARTAIPGFTLSENPDDPAHFYNYRFAFKAGAWPDTNDAAPHWPSDFKTKGHPSEVKGGFSTITGERVPGTPRAKDAAELVSMGYDQATATRLAATPEPADVSGLTTTKAPSRDAQLQQERAGTPLADRDVDLDGLTRAKPGKIYPLPHVSKQHVESEQARIETLVKPFEAAQADLEKLQTTVEAQQQAFEQAKAGLEKTTNEFAVMLDAWEKGPKTDAAAYAALQAAGQRATAEEQRVNAMVGPLNAAADTLRARSEDFNGKAYDVQKQIKDFNYLVWRRNIQDLGAPPSARTLTDMLRTKVGSLGQGVFQITGGMWGEIETLFRLGAESPLSIVPKELNLAVANYAKEQAANGAILAAQAQGNVEGRGYVEEAIDSGISSIGMMSATMIAAWMGVPPTTALITTMGIPTAGLSSHTALEKGVPVINAAVYGIADGTAEVVTEILPFTKFLADLKAGAPFAKMLWHQLISETPGEIVAQITQKADEWAALPEHRGKSIGDFIRDLPAELGSVLISVATTTSLMSTAGHMVARASAKLAGEDPTKPETEAAIAAKAMVIAEYVRFVETHPQEVDPDSPEGARFANIMSMATRAGVTSAEIAAALKIARGAGAPATTGTAAQPPAATPPPATPPPTTPPVEEHPDKAAILAEYVAFMRSGAASGPDGAKQLEDLAKRADAVGITPDELKAAVAGVPPPAAPPVTPVELPDPATMTIAQLGAEFRTLAEGDPRAELLRQEIQKRMAARGTQPTPTPPTTTTPEPTPPTTPEPPPPPVVTTPEPPPPEPFDARKVAETIPPDAEDHPLHDVISALGSMRAIGGLFNADEFTAGERAAIEAAGITLDRNEATGTEGYSEERLLALRTALKERREAAKKPAVPVVPIPVPTPTPAPEKPGEPPAEAVITDGMTDAEILAAPKGSLTDAQQDRNMFLRAEAKRLKKEGGAAPTTPTPTPESTAPLATNELPEYAQRAVMQTSAGRRTNEGGSIDAPDPFEGARWVRQQVPLTKILANPRNKNLGTKEFGARGSVTVGPIVIDDRGEVIDGNNRAHEAIMRGDKTIEAFVFQPAETKEAAPPAAAPTERPVIELPPGSWSVITDGMTDAQILAAPKGSLTDAQQDRNMFLRAEAKRLKKEGAAAPTTPTPEPTPTPAPEPEPVTPAEAKDTDIVTPTNGKKAGEYDLHNVVFQDGKIKADIFELVDGRWMYRIFDGDEPVADGYAGDRLEKAVETAKGAFNFWVKDREEAERQGEPTQPANTTSFRSGNQNAINDLDGFIKAGQPVGITAQAGEEVLARVIAYVKAGGKAFVDSGVFGNPDVDFADVFKVYARLVNAIGGHDTHNLSLVMPDKVGDQAATKELQELWGEEIEWFADRTRAILPVQVSDNLDQDIVDAVTEFPNVAIGLPGNKAAISLEQLQSAMAALEAEGIAELFGVHFLGMGERNRDFGAFVQAVHAVYPEADISSDSVRTTALMVTGRPAHTLTGVLTEERANQAIDNEPAGDTTELAGAFYHGNALATFTGKELKWLANAIGWAETRLVKVLKLDADERKVALESVDDRVVDMALSTLAKARMVAAERPGARADAIAVTDQKETEPEPEVAPSRRPELHQQEIDRLTADIRAVEKKMVAVPKSERATLEARRTGLMRERSQLIAEQASVEPARPASRDTRARTLTEDQEADLAHADISRRDRQGNEFDAGPVGEFAVVVEVMGRPDRTLFDAYADMLTDAELQVELDYLDDLVADPEMVEDNPELASSEAKQFRVRLASEIASRRGDQPELPGGFELGTRPVAGERRPFSADAFESKFGLEYDEAEAAEAIADAMALDKDQLELTRGGGPVAVEFANGGQALIRAMRGANVATAINALARVARRFLLDAKIPVAKREGITDLDINTAAQWAGATNKDGVWVWSDAAETRFARGLERYLLSDKAPLQSLDWLFQQVARWLGRIYQTLEGSAIDIDISPEMRKVYDKLLSRADNISEREFRGEPPPSEGPTSPVSPAVVPTDAVTPEGEANIQSAYQGENLDDLLAGAIDEQRDRFQAMRETREQISDPKNKDKTEKLAKLKQHLASIQAEYDGQYAEIESAGGPEAVARVRQAVEHEAAEPEAPPAAPPVEAGKPPDETTIGKLPDKGRKNHAHQVRVYAQRIRSALVGHYEGKDRTELDSFYDSLAYHLKALIADGSVTPALIGTVGDLYDEAQWKRLGYEEPVGATMPSEAQTGMTIHMYDGKIGAKFPTKPPQDVIDQLQRLGFRWKAKVQQWVAENSVRLLTALEGIKNAGVEPWRRPTIGKPTTPGKTLLPEPPPDHVVNWPVIYSAATIADQLDRVQREIRELEAEDAKRKSGKEKNTARIRELRQDLPLLVQYNAWVDPNTPREAKIALAANHMQRFLRKPDDVVKAAFGGEMPYDLLSREASRLLQEAGVDEKTAVAEGKDIANVLMGAPAFDYYQFAKAIPNKVARLEAEARVKAGLTALRKLEVTYGVQRSGHTDAVKRAETVEEMAAALAAAEADFKETKAKADAKEAERDAELAKKRADELEKAKVLAKAGTLVWRNLMVGGDTLWSAVEGEAVTVEGAPEGTKFWMYRTPKTDPNWASEKTWQIIEDQTGMAVGKGKTKAAATANANEAIAKVGDQFDTHRAKWLAKVTKKPKLYPTFYASGVSDITDALTWAGQHGIAGVPSAADPKWLKRDKGPVAVQVRQVLAYLASGEEIDPKQRTKIEKWLKKTQNSTRFGLKRAGKQELGEPSKYKLGDTLESAQGVGTVVAIDGPLVRLALQPGGKMTDWIFESQLTPVGEATKPTDAEVAAGQPTPRDMPAIVADVVYALDQIERLEKERDKHKRSTPEHAAIRARLKAWDVVSHKLTNEAYAAGFGSHRGVNEAFDKAFDAALSRERKKKNELVDAPGRLVVPEGFPPAPPPRPRRNAAGSEALEDALSPAAKEGLSEWFKKRNQAETLSGIRALLEVYDRLLPSAEALWRNRRTHDARKDDKMSEKKLAEAQAKLKAHATRVAADILENAEAFFATGDEAAEGRLWNLMYEGRQVISGEESPDRADLLEFEVMADSADAGRLIFDSLDPKTVEFDVEEFNTAYGMVEFRKDKDDVFPAPAEPVNLWEGRPVPPKKGGEWVGLGMRDGVPVLSQEEGKAKVAEWKAEAERIGKASDNSHRVVISLFDRTGIISDPWKAAGYTVRRFDIRPEEDGGTAEDLIDFGKWMDEVEELFQEGFVIEAILAQPPCTSFTNSGRQHWPKLHDAPNREWLIETYGEAATEYFDTPVDYANHLVAVVKLMVEQANPRIYVMENPVGRIDELHGLPDPTLKMHPDDYGDPWTKGTQLWGEFNPNLPTARVGGLEEEGGEGSKTWNLSSAQEDERSMTPVGFAYAFFMANHQETAAETDEEREDREAEDDIEREDQEREDEEDQAEDEDEGPRVNALGEEARQKYLKIFGGTKPSQEDVNKADDIAALASRLTDKWLVPDGTLERIGFGEIHGVLDLADLAWSPTGQLHYALKGTPRPEGWFRTQNDYWSSKDAAPPTVEPPVEPPAAPPPPTRPPRVTNPTPATKDEKLAAIEKEKEDTQAEINKLMAELKAKAGGQLSMGLDPTLVAPVAKLLRLYFKMGVLNFREFVVRFQKDYGEGARLFDDVLEAAWEYEREEEVSVADVMAEIEAEGEQPAAEPKTEEAETPAGEPPIVEGEDGHESPTLEGRPEGEPGADTGTGGRPDGTDVPDGEEPGTEGQAGARPGEGTGPRGTVSKPTPKQRPGSDPALATSFYRITDADEIGTGTVPERVARNFAAIRVIKQLEDEQRPATAEEQEILVKYVGWGGLARIFEYWKHDTNPETASFKNEWWSKQYNELQSLLTDDEFKRARNSTQNAHYTSPTVIRAMWQAVERLGVTHGSALETSGGIGHFLGLSPDSLRMGGEPGMTWAVVEKDSMSAKILKALYPAAFTQNLPFEKSHLPTGHFTIAIGNIPFGNVPVTDELLVVPPYIKTRIHNYFFAKALDKVAEGGLVAFITTHGTLDAKSATSQRIREYLGSQADFLGAIRLPHTAFKGNAGTEVVADIIFLRKRRKGETANHVSPWFATREIELPNKNGTMVPQSVNEYMLDHPEMVLGIHTSTGQMRGADMYNVEPSGVLADHLADAIQNLPKNVIDTSLAGPSLDSFRATMPPIGARPYEFRLNDNGKLAQVIDGQLVEVKLDPADEVRVRGLMRVRVALRDVYDRIAEGATPEALTAAQEALTKQYDTFVKRHGFITLDANWKLFREDPDVALLLSLEDYDDVTEKATKSDIFTTKHVETQKADRKAETPQEALHIALGETGRIDLDRMGELLGKTPEDTATALAAEGLILFTPTGWMLPAQYLSGNVRVKLKEAETAAELDTRYEPAVEALRQVIPVDLKPFEINARLGVGWIPASIVTQFIKEHVDAEHNFTWTVTYNVGNAKWAIDGSPKNHTSPLATPDYNGKQLLLAALNDHRITIKTYDKVLKRKVLNPTATALARARREQLYRQFQTWLFTKDQARSAWATKTYNERFNAYVEPRVDGSYLTFPGLSAIWRERVFSDGAKHQLNAIARILQFGNTLLTHVVGAGKTLEMIAAGMEMRRLGLARKPLYVVPNHLVSQFPRDFLEMYPNAKVLVTTPEDLEKDNRKRFTGRVAAGDYDAVVMPYSVFVRVSMSPEAEQAYQQELLDEIEAAILAEYARLEAEEREGRKRNKGGQRSKPPSVKRLEAVRDRIQRRLDKIANRPKDEMLSFEQLGVDALFVDEAHSFKNLYFHTRQQAAGIPQDNEAQRATDLYLKARYINQLSGNRNIVFATGTPVSNSMAEIFVMQKFLQENVLIRAGIDKFDAWLAQFGTISIKPELDPSGSGVGPRARLADFRNLADLATMFRQMSDVKMIDDLPLLKARRPQLQDDKIESIEIPATDLQVQYLAALAHRADHLDPKDRRSDNMAKITVDGRMSALDMRMIDRRHPDDPGSKIHKVAETVADIYKKYADVQGTQLVFMDSGTPGADERSKRPRDYIDLDTGEKKKRPPTEAEANRGIDMYEDLRQKLIARGVPENQIAFIQDLDLVPDKKRDAARKALFRKVREGKIRVLMGSSGTMGTGMNVQDRLVALHNVDPTYKPSDMEQRNGRILRQGNLFHAADPDNFRIRIINYLTVGRGTRFGFDAYMWQLNEAKARIIAQFFKGKVARNLALDLDQVVLTAGEMKAVSTGNPLIIDLAKAEAEVFELRLVESGWRESQMEAGWAAAALAERVPALKEEHAKTARIAEATVPREPDAPLTAVLGDNRFKGHKVIGEEIIRLSQEKTEPDEDGVPRPLDFGSPHSLGKMRGLTVWLEFKHKKPFVVLRHPADPASKYHGTDSHGQSLAIVEPLLTVSKDAGTKWRDPVGLLNTLTAKLDRLANDAKFLDEEIAEKSRELAALKVIRDAEFEQAGELAAALRRVEELQTALGFEAPEEEDPGTGEGEEEEPGGEEEEEDDITAGDISPTGVRRARGTAVADEDEDTGTYDADRPVAATQQELDAIRKGLPPPAKTTIPATIEEPTADPADTVDVHPIEGPEMLEFARMLLGAEAIKVVRKFRKAGTRGEFRADSAGRGEIRLNAELFKKENLQQLTDTLAHEIGHLIDWLPDFLLKRGNLLGRLHALKKFGKGTFTNAAGTEIKDSVIRKELMDLSAKWRPWDRDAVDENFRKYRDSAVELWADAMSVAINNPALLEKEAPTFFTAFYEGLDTRPDVKQAYFEIQDILRSSTRVELVQRRLDRILQMYNYAETKALDMLRMREAEKALTRVNIMARLRELSVTARADFIDKNAPIRDIAARAGMDPDVDARYLAEERSYIGGQLKAWMERHVQPIYNGIRKAGISWGEFGTALFLERVIAGDRSEMANPQNFTPKEAKEAYGLLLSKMTPEQRDALKAQIDHFRIAVKDMTRQAYEIGLITDKMWEKIDENPAYAAFQTIEHIDEDVTWHVRHQIGTLKDIRNPADTTLLKMLNTIRAIETQRLRLATWELLKQEEPTAIQQAKETGFGQHKQIHEPKDTDNWTLVTYYERGVRRGKYVPKLIGNSLLNVSHGANMSAVKVLRFINSWWFRPIFTTYNPGFQSYNLWRDFRRFWKNMPNMSLFRALARYWQGKDLSGVRAFGLVNKDSGALRALYRRMRLKPGYAPTEKELAAWETLMQAEEAKILSITFNDFNRARTIGDTVIEDTMAGFGVGEYGPTSTKIPILKQGAALREWMKNVGDYIETLPKAAAIYEFMDRQPNPRISVKTGKPVRDARELPADVRSFIRRKVGSPDFLAGGSWKPLSNELLLFSNAITQAWRADWEVARDTTKLDKRAFFGLAGSRRAEFWWKTAMVDIAPKMAIFAAVMAAQAAAGGGDDDDKKDDGWLAYFGRAYQGISEYDLTNYMNFALWTDDKGNTVSIRMPQDDAGRLISGIVWKVMQMFRGDRDVLTAAQQVLDYTAGQMPSKAPFLGVPGEFVEFASGRNIYDAFRGRFVFTQDQVDDKDFWRKTGRFLKYEFNQLGGGIVYRFDIGVDRPSEKTPGQVVLDSPVLSNIVGRWLRISDYGKVEADRRVAKDEGRNESTIREDMKAEVNETLREFQSKGGQISDAEFEREAADIVARVYKFGEDDVKLQREKEKDVETRLRKGLTRGASDSTVESVLGATTNGQKLQILLNARKRMGRTEFDTWLQQAKDDKVVSKELASDLEKAMASSRSR